MTMYISRIFFRAALLSQFLKFNVLGVRGKNGTAELSEEYLAKEFANFITNYQRSYTEGSEEYHTRYPIFKENYINYETHNNQLPAPNFYRTIDEHSDLTKTELKTFHGYKRSYNPSSGSSLLEVDEETQKIAEFEKLRDVLLTTESKKYTSYADFSPEIDHFANCDVDQVVQGSCGSCWIVSGMAMFRYLDCKAGRPQLQPSLQQMVDCVPNPRSCGGEGGCEGATVELLLDYIVNQNKADNVWPEDQYKYNMKTGTCKQLPADLKESFKSEYPNSYIKQYQGKHFAYATLPKNKEFPMREMLQSNIVAISVDAQTFHGYKSGVFDDCEGHTTLGHAVIAYGYGKTAKEEGGLDFIRIRNSWGKQWGDNGNMKFKVNYGKEEENAQIDYEPQKGVGCKGDPATMACSGNCCWLADSVVLLEGHQFKGLGTNLHMEIQKNTLQGGNMTVAPHQPLIFA